MSKTLNRNELSTLEAVFIRALRAFFPKLKADDAKTDFFAVYQKEAEEYDKEFTKKHDEDLNTTLIFAGLFSAVTSAFVIDVQRNLQPDYTQQTATLLLVLVQNMGNSTFSGSDISPLEFSVDPIMVIIQILLYASLATSLLAAFLGVLGKQWLNRYMRRKGGSAIERCRYRQIKAEGLVNWYFPIVMEVLPLMLQVALLLLGCALSQYLWTVNHAVAALNIAVTGFGVLLYTVFVVVATFSYACPYQTPFFIALRYIIDFDTKNTGYLHRINSSMESTRKKYSDILQGMKAWMSGLLRYPSSSRTRDTESGDDLNLQEMSDFNTDTAEILFKSRHTELKEHSLNASCIIWLCETSTDPDVMASVIKWVPEVEWDASLNTGPLIARLSDTHFECFDTSHAIIPGARDKAFDAMKALFHTYMQRGVTGEPIDAIHTIWKERRLHMFKILDDELRSACEIFDHCVSQDESHHTMFFTIDLNTFSASGSHFYCICHALVYYVWQCKRFHIPLPVDLDLFLEHCLSQKPPLPKEVIADCLVIIGLTFGMPLHVQDLSVTDKTGALSDVAKFMCTQLGGAFQTHSPVVSTERAVVALRLFSLSEVSYLNARTEVAQSFRKLLNTIGYSSVEDGIKWEAAQLLLKTYSRFGKKISIFRYVTWPELEGVFKYLEHQVNLPVTQQREGYDGALADAFSAIAPAYQNSLAPVIGDERVVKWMCDALASNRSGILRWTVLDVFVWFPWELDDTETRMATFHPDRVSKALQQFWIGLPQESHKAYSYGYVRILCKMAASRSWKRFLVHDHWRAIEDLYGDPDYQYHTNWLPSLIKAVGDAPAPLLDDIDNREATRVWLTLAWNRYDMLTIQALYRVVKATAVFIVGEESIVSTFTNLPDSWMERGGHENDDPEDDGSFTNLMETYLRVAWRHPWSWETDMSQPIFDATLELYRYKGHAVLDRDISRIPIVLKSS